MQHAYLFYAWKHHDWVASTKGTYGSHLHKKHIACGAHYWPGHYGHCVIYAVHYNNYDHLVSGNTILSPSPCYFRAQLNSLYLIHSAE